MYTPKKEIYKNLLGYITGYNMKKFLCVAMIATISTASFAYTEQLSSSELKSMDCATLAVEKSNAKRAAETADKNIQALSAQAQAPGNALGKWAGLAGNALSAFGGHSEKATRASQVAQSLSGSEQAEESAANLSVQQETKANAQANLENIAIFQNSKKCKF